MSNCLVCGECVLQNLSISDYFQKDDIVCGSCRSLFHNGKIIHIDNLEIEGLFIYTEEIENLMFTLKEGRDIALAPIFLHLKKQYIQKKYKKYQLIYAPSSLSKSKQRGFFVLEELFKDIKLIKHHAFEKTEDYKQSLQLYKDRKNIVNVIKRNDLKLHKKKVLLIDDVCTSGSTLLSMYHILKKEGYYVKAFVIALHPSLLD